MRRQSGFILPLAMSLIGAGLITPASAAPVRGISKAKPSNFPQIKASLARQGKLGKQVYSELKAVWRSEQRLRGPRIAAERASLAASAAFNANPNPATLDAWKRAHAAAEAATKPHENAASALASVKEKVSYTMDGRHAELVTLRAMKARGDAMAARRALPRFAASAQVATLNTAPSGPVPAAPVSGPVAAPVSGPPVKYARPSQMLRKARAAAEPDSLGPQRPIPASTLVQNRANQTQDVIQY